MFKKMTLVLGALCLGIFANAQDENDALLLGRTYQYGTARNLSLSGATGSLGADFGGISNNPAGLGLYRKSEFSFTPNVLVSNTESGAGNNNTLVSESKFNFNQTGIVFAKAKKGRAYNKSKWKTSNFAIGFNRLANLHTDYAYTVTDTKSSFVENFAEEINAAGGLSYDANGNAQLAGAVSAAAQGAFNTYIVDIDLNDSTRVASFVPFNTGIDRSKTIRRKGGINELALSYGANYNEKVLIGATIGFPMVSYTEREILTEDDISGDNNNDFDYVDLVQNLGVDGTGVNVKLGAIFKPSNNFRFGAALHTPTWYSITEVSNVEFEANTENYQGQIREDGIPGNTFDYSFQTPMKATGSATALFGKQGFISADVEWINYEGMRYNYNGFEVAESAVNTAIQQTYQNAMNIRLGGEVRLDEIALRAGYGYFGNPYQDFSGGAGQSASLGLGYRTKSFYLDLAGQYLFTEDSDVTHTLARNAEIPAAVVGTRNTQIAMTMGFRF